MATNNKHKQQRSYNKLSWSTSLFISVIGPAIPRAAISGKNSVKIDLFVFLLIVSLINGSHTTRPTLFHFSKQCYSFIYCFSICRCRPLSKSFWLHNYLKQERPWSLWLSFGDSDPRNRYFPRPFFRTVRRSRLGSCVVSCDRSTHNWLQLSRWLISTTSIASA